MIEKLENEIRILLNIISDMSSYIMMLKRVNDIEIPAERLEILYS